MINHSQNEDIVCFAGKSNLLSKIVKKEIKRVHKIC
jgi:hypothetical protein